MFLALFVHGYEGNTGPTCFFVESHEANAGTVYPCFDKSIHRRAPQSERILGCPADHCHFALSQKGCKHLTYISGFATGTDFQFCSIADLALFDQGRKAEAHNIGVE